MVAMGRDFAFPATLGLMDPTLRVEEEIVPAMANRQQNDVLRSLCRVARNLPETSPCLVEILDWKVVCYQMAIAKLEVDLWIISQIGR